MKKQSRYISVSLVFLLLLQLFVFGTSSKVYATNGPLRVQMYTETTSSTTNQLSPRFKIYNDGTSSIDMSNVKLRYYYTKEGSATQNFACDTFLIDNVYTTPTAITHNFTDMTSPLSNCNNYLEIGFPAGVSLAANKCIELQTRIYKQDYSNYDQSNDYSFNPTNTTYGDWDKVTAYTSGTLSWGVDPNGTPGKKFLVIVSSKIIDYCSTAIDTYISDLSNEGWAPTLIKVNNEADTAHPDALVCPTAQALKDEIETYYNQGYEGFVIIGSTPSIPYAQWRSNPSSTDQGPTDLFYADMGDWTDIGNDGVYEGYTDSSLNQPANPSNPKFIPDMIYGRISAGAISGSYQQEGARTAAYLSKIHDYRLSGNMSCDPKVFFFVEDDWVGTETGIVSNIRNLEKDIYSISNRSTSTEDTYMQFLQGGYRMGFQTIHSGGSTWSFIKYPNGTEGYSNSDYASIADINNMTVKVNYLHCNSCTGCNYNNENLGAAILFNNANSSSDYANSYVYNVTGETIPTYFDIDAAYCEDLNTNTIGTSFKNMVSRKAESGGTNCPAYILLGDPTLNYNFTNPENECPHITNDLSDVNAYPGRPFKLTFNTTDPENDTVYVDVTDLPDGATYDSSTKTLDWMPLASQVGNSYNVTVTAYNKDASGVPLNKYVQIFTIFVSRMTLTPVQINNPGFETLNTDGTPSGWTSVNEEFSSDSSVKHSGNYSASVTNNPNDGWSEYHLNTTVEPNTHYLLSGYIKTSNVTGDLYDKGACLFLSADGTSSVYSAPIVGTQDWTPVYLHWYSGSNTTLNLNCLLDGMGTAWFDDLKLEKDYNLGFELPKQGVISLANWTSYTQNTDSDTMSVFFTDTAIKQSGLQSIRILSNQAPNYAYLSNEIDVEPNSGYTVSVWIRTNATGVTGNTGATFKLQCGNASATTSSVCNTFGNWVMYDLPIYTGTNTKMTIKCCLGDTTDLSLGTAWFDNITVTKTY